jgi:hypothetical protein
MRFFAPPIYDTIPQDKTAAKTERRKIFLREEIYPF